MKQNTRATEDSRSSHRGVPPFQVPESTKEEGNHPPPTYPSAREVRAESTPNSGCSFCAASPAARCCVNGSTVLFPSKFLPLALPLDADRLLDFLCSPLLLLWPTVNPPFIFGGLQVWFLPGSVECPFLHSS